MDKTGIKLLPKLAASCGALEDLHAKIPVVAPPPHRCPSQPCARQSSMTPVSHRQRGPVLCHKGVSSSLELLFLPLWVTAQSSTALSYSSGY